MRRVSDLLRTPAGRRLTLVAGPWDAREVGSVVLVDEMRELTTAAPGALAILSRHAMRSCDVLDALRLAGRGGLAGIVLPGPSGTTREIVELARRERVALLAERLRPLAVGHRARSQRGRTRRSRAAAAPYA